MDGTNSTKQFPHYEGCSRTRGTNWKGDTGHSIVVKKDMAKKAGGANDSAGEKGGGRFTTTHWKKHS